MDEAFAGRVAQIRMNPTRHDAAITYTVVVAAENSGEMLPDMTANLQFEVEHRPHVLLIPNDALCLPPQSPQPLPDLQAVPTGSPARAPDTTAFSLAKLSGARHAARLWKEQRMHHHLWVKEGEEVRPIEVQVGESNATMTEIIGKDVREGMEVVLGDVCRKDGP
jgi:HlyD family secretion protein